MLKFRITLKKGEKISRKRVLTIDKIEKENIEEERENNSL